MGKSKRGYVPLTAPPMKSRRRARKVTSLFHDLTHALAKVRDDREISAAERTAKTAEIQRQIDEMGGREAYQDASILSTAFHKTSKWVFQLLTLYKLRPASKQPALKLLEVGAINTQLLSCPWLDVTAIDLVSRHERIKQCDFFEFPVTDPPQYAIVVSSMVLNCVPTGQLRGKMLQMYRRHLKPAGLLFLMIPKLCLRPGSSMTYDKFCALLKAIGFEIKNSKSSPKVEFFCLERIENVCDDDFSEFKAPAVIKQNRFDVFL